MLFPFSNEQVAAASMDTIKKLAGFPQGMVGGSGIGYIYVCYLFKFSKIKFGYIDALISIFI